MGFMGYILRSLNVLNLLLAALCLALLFFVVAPSFRTGVGYTLPKSKESPPSTVDENPAPGAAAISYGDYQIISEKNLFHPERKQPTIKAAEVPVIRPVFVLYGTLIAGDLKLAYMEDRNVPYRTAGRGPRQRTLRIGNELSGYAVANITHDKVVMLKGEDRIEVGIIDKSKNRAAAGQPAKVQVQNPPVMK